MSFGENLKNSRKRKNITQEELAEILGVSRQAVSKWESDAGYPETEKLLAISKTLHISIDTLLNNTLQEAKESIDKNNLNSITGKIAIWTHHKKELVFCDTIKINSVAWAGKNEPKYVLYGKDKTEFLGGNYETLGWYASLEDIKKEMAEITAAIQHGENAYEIKYHANVKEGFLSVRLK
ncbi:MAG: helix-turn-helix transcriptional regulator [Eubacteriales bacterium]|nr:helix-turn-helix transcriptional regulator [Eubacteriales bacterium]